MNELSLFTGAGGGILGTHGLLNWRCLGYVEWEEYAQKVIRARIEDGILDEAPIFSDVREFVESGAARQYRGYIDVVSGGFPCQPFSVAGKREGDKDERDMWPATLGVIREVRPRFCFLENVRGLLSFNDGAYFRQILGQLSEAGYDARWCVLSARDCGAPHKRERLWIVADAKGERHRESRERGNLPRQNEPEKWAWKRGALCGEPCRAGCESKDLADADEARLQRSEHTGGIDASRRQVADGHVAKCRCVLWDTDPAEGPTESRLGRVANGVAYRVDRLKAIGNGQVPLVAATAWRILTEGVDCE